MSNISDTDIAEEIQKFKLKSYLGNNSNIENNKCLYTNALDTYEDIEEKIVLLEEEIDENNINKIANEYPLFWSLYSIRENERIKKLCKPNPKEQEKINKDILQYFSKKTGILFDRVNIAGCEKNKGNSPCDEKKPEKYLKESWDRDKKYFSVIIHSKVNDIEKKIKDIKKKERFINSAEINIRLSNNKNTNENNNKNTNENNNKNTNENNHDFTVFASVSFCNRKNPDYNKPIYNRNNNNNNNDKNRNLSLKEEKQRAIDEQIKIKIQKIINNSGRNFGEIRSEKETQKIEKKLENRKKEIEEDKKRSLEEAKRMSNQNKKEITTDLLGNTRKKLDDTNFNLILDYYCSSKDETFKNNIVENITEKLNNFKEKLSSIDLEDYQENQMRHLTVISKQLKQKTFETDINKLKDMQRKYGKYFNIDFVEVIEILKEQLNYFSGIKAINTLKKILNKLIANEKILKENLKQNLNNNNNNSNDLIRQFNNFVTKAKFSGEINKKNIDNKFRDISKYTHPDKYSKASKEQFLSLIQKGYFNETERDEIKNALESGNTPLAHNIVEDAFKQLLDDYRNIINNLELIEQIQFNQEGGTNLTHRNTKRIKYFLKDLNKIIKEISLTQYALLENYDNCKKLFKRLKINLTLPNLLFDTFNTDFSNTYAFLFYIILHPGSTEEFNNENVKKSLEFLCSPRHRLLSELEQKDIKSVMNSLKSAGNIQLRIENRGNNENENENNQQNTLVLHRNTATEQALALTNNKMRKMLNEFRRKAEEDEKRIRNEIKKEEEKIIKSENKSIQNKLRDIEKEMKSGKVELRSIIKLIKSLRRRAKELEQYEEGKNTSEKLLTQIEKIRESIELNNQNNKVKKSKQNKKPTSPSETSPPENKKNKKKKSNSFKFREILKEKNKTKRFAKIGKIKYNTNSNLEKKLARVILSSSELVSNYRSQIKNEEKSSKPNRETINRLRKSIDNFKERKMEYTKILLEYQKLRNQLSKEINSNKIAEIESLLKEIENKHKPSQKNLNMIKNLNKIQFQEVPNLNQIKKAEEKEQRRMQSIKAANKALRLKEEKRKTKEKNAADREKQRLEKYYEEQLEFARKRKEEANKAKEEKNKATKESNNAKEKELKRKKLIKLLKNKIKTLESKNKLSVYEKPSLNRYKKELKTLSEINNK